MEKVKGRKSLKKIYNNSIKKQQKTSGKMQKQMF